VDGPTATSDNVRTMRIASGPALALVVVALGCSGGEGDHRFLTPEATVRSLFTAYAIEDIPEQAVLARMERGGRFTPEDVAGYRACFADFRGPADEGLAGYVFGALAAGKDHLRYEQDGELATVLPTDDEGPEAPRIVLRRAGGEWKIVIRESVPADVRARLFQLYGRAEERAGRAGLGE
jgi:hypothetical protein